MFERFTKDAREIVVQAKALALELDHPGIGSEHLLLALLDSPAGIAADVLHANGSDVERLRADIEKLHSPTQGVLTDADAEALRSVGIDLDAVLARIEESFGPDALQSSVDGRLGRRRPHGRFNAESKKGLELSLREALRLHSREINTGHLLLGLVRDTGSQASRLLVAHGWSLTDVRAATESALRRVA